MTRRNLFVVAAASGLVLATMACVSTGTTTPTPIPTPSPTPSPLGTVLLERAGVEVVDLVIVALWITMGLLTATIAAMKGEDVRGWLILGFMVWFVALPALIFQKRDKTTGTVDKAKRHDSRPQNINHRIPSSVRYAVLDRDDYLCRYCGRRSQTMEVDHIIPVSQGGTSTLENLVTACRNCNRKKAGRTPEEAGMKILRVRTRRRQR